MSDCIRFPRLKVERCNIEASLGSIVSDCAVAKGCCARSTLPGMTSTSIPYKQTVVQRLACVRVDR